MDRYTLGTLAVLLCGCATVTTGSSRNLSVDTDPAVPDCAFTPEGELR